MEMEEHKQTEERLRLSEERFANAFYASPAGMTITRIADGTFVDANESFCRMFEFSREEVVGHTSTALKLWTPEERKKLIDEQIRSGGLQNFELQARSKSGRVIHLLFSSNPIELEGEPHHITTMIDITELKRAEEALRESENRLRLATRAGNIGVWDWDIVKNELIWDDSMYMLYGVRKEDFGGAYEAWSGALHPDDREYAEGEIQAALRGEREYAATFRIVCPDGAVRILKADSQIIHDANGNPLRMIGTNIDITERKRAEEALSESEKRFREIAETINEVFWVGAADWSEVYYVSPAYERIWGRTVQSLYEQPLSWVDAVHPDDQEVVWLDIDAKSDGRSATPDFMPYRVVRPDGSISWIFARAFPILNPDGQVARIVGIAEDITERKRAEEALCESEALLNATSQIAKVGGWELDALTFEVRWTDETYRIHEVPLDYKPPLQEAINFFHPDDRGKLADAIQRALDNGEPYDMEIRFITAKGNHLWTRTVCQPQMVDGKVSKLKGIFIDITERKRAEEQIKQNLKEKETLLRELYHRTKNNMQVIRAMLILKAESHQNAEITAFAQEIEQKILAMALVHQKLYQSQDLSQVDLSEYLKELAHLIIQSYSVVSPRITLKLELDLVPVLIDTAIPCGLLVNELMSNALKHAFPEERAGEISIKLWRTFAGIIELSFADNGVGLPEGFDIREQPTLGLQTIVGLAEQQLQGEIHYDGQHGLAYVIRFHDNFYTPRVST